MRTNPQQLSLENAGQVVPLTWWAGPSGEVRAHFEAPGCGLTVPPEEVPAWVERFERRGFVVEDRR